MTTSVVLDRGATVPVAVTKKTCFLVIGRDVEGTSNWSGELMCTANLDINGKGESVLISEVS